MNVIENQNNKLENKCIVSFYSNKRGIDIVSQDRFYYCGTCLNAWVISDTLDDFFHIIVHKIQKISAFPLDHHQILCHRYFRIYILPDSQSYISFDFSHSRSYSISAE